MSQLSVSIPPHQLAELEALGSGESMRRALYNAYKDTARNIRVATQTAIRSRSSLAVKTIRKAIEDKVDYPMTMSQRGRVTIIQRGISLSEYGPKSSKSFGVRVKMPKGELVLKHAFIRTMPNKARLTVTRGKKLPMSGPNAFKTRYKPDGEKMPAHAHLMTFAEQDAKLNTSRWRKGRGFTPKGFVQRLTLENMRGASVLNTFGATKLTEIGRKVMAEAQQLFEKNLAKQIVFRSLGPQKVFDRSNTQDFTGER
jgi:hypothetical protein